ncbi:MAG: sodium/proton-translocating pyrophosphatase, partial [Acidobacteria bacterium]|nr:sodium/proton-translocating pyrophosphatase [Acidobacteriota bacterium]
MNPEIWLYVAMAMGVLSLAVAAFYASQVLSADPGNEEMVRLMSVIRKGAMAFLRREYLAIVVFVALLAVLLVIFLPWGWPWGAVAYVFGASLSALAGFIGMRFATAAN